MNHAKLSLFGANILSSYSVEIDDLDGNTIATFKQGDSAGDFATEVLKHDGVGLGIYYKDSDWCYGGIYLLKTDDDASGAAQVCIDNYSKSMHPLIPHNHPPAEAALIGG